MDSSPRRNTWQWESRPDGKGRQLSSQPQTSKTISFREAKTLLWSLFKTDRTTLNRGFRQDQDALPQLDRKLQTVIFRLRTGHRGLRAHLKRIGQAETLQPGIVEMTIKRQGTCSKPAHSLTTKGTMSGPPRRTSKRSSWGPQTTSAWQPD